LSIILKDSLSKQLLFIFNINRLYLCAKTHLIGKVFATKTSTISFDRGEKPVINWKKEAVAAKICFVRIHFIVIIKLFIVKGFTYAILKIFH